ncbi:11581_t:CDS:2, partial [Entrophospora sp. SA101]
PKSQTFPEYEIVEELTFDLCIVTLLLQYRRILEEMWNPSHIRIATSPDTYLQCSNSLTAITSVLLYSSTPCRGPGGKPSENHIKAQMWTEIFSDTFLIGSEDIDMNWEYHHQILES